MQEDTKRHSDERRSRRSTTGYLPVEDYGLIGNMRTCALVGTDGGIDFMCWPHFDSPSVFARMLDKDKGGHFTISPAQSQLCTTKQQYLPSSNILQTRYLHEDGVMNLVDFFPRPNNSVLDAEFHARVLKSRHDGKGLGGEGERPDMRKWLVRRVECLRGEIDVDVELFPGFNYAQDKHTVEVIANDHPDGNQKVIFKSPGLNLELVVLVDYGEKQDREGLLVKLRETALEPYLGNGVTASFPLSEGQTVSFVIREYIEKNQEPVASNIVSETQRTTQEYWCRWISQSKYHGRWEDVVARSLFILKLLTFEPTGAIVAAPTFSLPEDFGGGRNWDYRFSWVRDSSFTIYILLRLGFKHEAEAYTSFIFQRVAEVKARQGALPIMFTIRGETDIPEIELTHLDGYRSSRPVRIGNGAASHIQLDIYGELMDGIYLANKFGKPTTYDQWLSVRGITDYVCKIWKEKDMVSSRIKTLSNSIWEVRGKKQDFVYSKIMMWVAIDRAIRLADKRCFPCPHRLEWYKVRDQICEEVMEKGYNSQLEAFIQSYEANDVLDSSILIAPLVFFISPTDPRFLKTLDRILKPPEKGGLTSTGLVYRYNSAMSDDGVGGREGAFSMCTFWLVEALTRAGAYDPTYLNLAVSIFENILSFGNHVHMFSEEIARSGEQLGNTPQAFSHLALISAAFNLDRTLGKR